MKPLFFGFHGCHWMEPCPLCPLIPGAQLATIKLVSGTKTYLPRLPDPACKLEGSVRMLVVLVYSGCYDKILQTKWLIKKRYFSTVLEFEISKIKVLEDKFTILLPQPPE